MQLALTSEQAQLVDLADRWVAREAGVEARRGDARATAPLVRARARWRQLGELGLLALGIPEQHGGMGLSAVDTLLVMEALGRGAVVEPVVPAAVMAPRLLAAHAPSCRPDGLLSQLAGGAACVVPAWYEPGKRFALRPSVTRARRTGAGWTLDGTKINVAGGDLATHLVVSADAEGQTLLLLVAVDLAGVERRSARAIDGSGTADFTLREVRVEPDALVGAPGQGAALLQEALDHGCAALAAQSAGAMAALLERTLEHQRTRRQFGKTLSQFQVLQHRAVEMLSMASSVRAIALQATAGLESGAAGRAAAASAAKSLAGRHGRTVGEQAIQLHGGMGMTDELAAGHYFKRLACIDMVFGDSAWHLQRYLQATTTTSSSGNA
jgi:alkylation response protein AidB-like acyl-CoA dehydrogenase